MLAIQSMEGPPRPLPGPPPTLVGPESTEVRQPKPKTLPCKFVVFASLETMLWADQILDI
ncbi:hypothetical protein NW766_008933 [Fusarium irregulare]|uniref:Uncharacterized protein n=1 Tax=Fusarium irregulare TaxID=2494466 RepID=A0A9W8PLJ3_9HYPO|nr:hypothetical protein NW766_008933 [Fusarium irregulare]